MQEDKRPIVFISYAWDDEQHKEWVLRLAKDLISVYGIDVLLDQFELRAGHSLTHFMNKSVLTADKVLIIGSPKYKQRANESVGGVGYEHSLITQGLYELQSINEKYLPVLRLGKKTESFPGYINTLVYHSMVDNDRYQSDLEALARLIYNKPAIEKPKLGPIPDFDKQVPKDPLLEKFKNVKHATETEHKKAEFLRSREATELADQEVTNLFTTIKDLVTSYNQKMSLGFKFVSNSDTGVLYSGVNRAVVIQWTGNRHHDMSDAFLWIRFTSGTIVFTPNGVSWSDPSIKIMEEKRLYCDVDADLNIVWTDLKTKETQTSNELIGLWMVWIYVQWENHQKELVKRNRARD